MNMADVRKIVRDGYGKVAKTGASCCAPRKSCGCKSNSLEDISRNVGYSHEDLQSLPDGANLGLGCGNPVALASIKEGETVLDLGSGAGIDCFLAAKRVGKNGKVIGVDMTPEMLERARANLAKMNLDNVDFRMGEIEHLPFVDNTVDLVISNCVINLSPDKAQVFQEAHRVLKSGGRMMVSDIVILKPLPEALKNSIQAYVGCLAGAVLKDEYLDFISQAGFKDVKVIDEKAFPVDEAMNNPSVKAGIDKMNIGEGAIKEAANAVLSIKVSAHKR